MSIRTSLLRFLRVPAAPSAPAGDEHVRVFRAAPNFFRYRLVKWIVSQAGTVVGLIFGVLMLRQAHRVIPETIEVGSWILAEDTILMLLVLVEVFAVAIVITQAALSLALLRLDFEQRWYLVSDRSLRIREGLVRLHEKTMTFANIQQLTIRQGPVQRLLGIADLEVRTAGGGGSSDENGVPNDDLHVGYFRGVDEPEKIRDAIREQLRRHRDAGLGDPDDHAADAAEAPHATLHASSPGSSTALPPGNGLAAAGGYGTLVDAAAALLREAAALRVALQR